MRLRPLTLHLSIRYDVRQYVLIFLIAIARKIQILLEIRHIDFQTNLWP